MTYKKFAKVTWCWEDVQAQIMDIEDCSPEDIKMTQKEMEDASHGDYVIDKNGKIVFDVDEKRQSFF